MGNLWQFFGLPDPEIASPAVAKKSVKKKETNNLIQGKLIQEEDKVDIKPSMIQPVQEIKALGKFKTKISLHSEVDAEIIIDVHSAETIQ